MIVSIATAVLPVWRSPMISSRCPRPTGTSESTALSPDSIGSCTDWRAMIPGAFTSMRWRVTSPEIGPLPSIGSPRPSTTRPRSPSPTPMSMIAPVRFTVSPSLIARSLPKTTTPTLSFSRLSAIPRSPESNSTISPACTFCSPCTRAMPSPIASTLPISSMSTLNGSPMIFEVMIDESSAADGAPFLAAGAGVLRNWRADTTAASRCVTGAARRTCCVIAMTCPGEGKERGSAGREQRRAATEAERRAQFPRVRAGWESHQEGAAAAREASRPAGRRGWSSEEGLRREVGARASDAG